MFQVKVSLPCPLFRLRVLAHRQAPAPQGRKMVGTLPSLTFYTVLSSCGGVYSRWFLFFLIKEEYFPTPIPNFSCFIEKNITCPFLKR